MLCKALSVSLVSVFLLVAREGAAAEKRHAEAHVHGVAEINIAVEGRKIVVEFRTPTEGLMGFEHEAKNDAEKRKRDAPLKLINDKFPEMVILDRKPGCRSEGGKVAIVQSDPDDRKDKNHGSGDHKMSGEHREVHATFTFECRGDPVGSRVQFGVTKLFPEIHELKVQVLSDAKQSGATIKKDQGDVRL
ncbi:MAG TPA: DUF2796 domain-containing protein [Candidatus Binatia bacterium]|jgi:hypothetical protein